MLRNMAPKEGDGPSDANVGGGYSCFWNRLSTLPVVQGTIQTTVGIYSSSKEKHALIGKGLGYLEYGVGLAVPPVKNLATALVEKYPTATNVATNTATKLDTIACNALETIETKVPAIQKPPMQIVTSVKKGTSTALHTGVRKVMKSYPGQQMVRALDSMIAWSEMTLEVHQLKQLTKEIAQGPGQEEDRSGEEEEKDQGPTMTLKNGAVIPLKLYLQALKLVKHILANMAGVKTRPSSTSASPKKAASIGHRKKASPKKRLAKKGLVTRIAGSAMSLLGLRKQGEVLVDDLCKRLHSSENVNERNDKRKHDECIDSDSDAESLNLASALDNYVSDEDSDYVPDHNVSDDSDDYSSGEAESDIEVEEMGRSKKGEPLRQIVDKKAKAPSLTSPSATAAPNAPPPSPQVSLQPEWKKTEQSEA